MERKKPSLLGRILGITLAVLALGALAWGLVYNLNRCGVYARVYENPVYVQAQVTRHSEYEDSDDNTTYYSYITYTVGGATYENVQYESFSTASKRTPLHTTLTVALNPENHGELLQKVASPLLTVFLCAIALALVVVNLQSFRARSLQRASEGRPDRDKIAKDLQTLIASRFLRVFWMGLTVVLGLLHRRFPILFGTGYLVATVGAGCCWLCCLFNALRDGNRVRKGNFTVRWDQLLKKESESDGEGGVSYCLYYVSKDAPDRVWCRQVSREAWDAAREGSVIQAVYLPGDKKPKLTYGASEITVD